MLIYIYQYCCKLGKYLIYVCNDETFKQYLKVSLYMNRYKNVDIVFDEYAYTCRALTTMAFKLDLAIDIHTNVDRDIVNYAQRTLRWTVFTALLESINIWPNLRLKQRPLVGVSNTHLVGLQKGIKNHVDALYLQRQQKRQAQIWLIHFDLHKKHV